jgi:hypothetical protein
MLHAIFAEQGGINIWIKQFASKELKTVLGHLFKAIANFLPDHRGDVTLEQILSIVETIKTVGRRNGCAEEHALELLRVILVNFPGLPKNTMADVWGKLYTYYFQQKQVPSDTVKGKLLHVLSFMASLYPVDPSIVNRLRSIACNVIATSNIHREPQTSAYKGLEHLLGMPELSSEFDLPKLLKDLLERLKEICTMPTDRNRQKLGQKKAEAILSLFANHATKVAPHVIDDFKTWTSLMEKLKRHNYKLEELAVYTTDRMIGAILMQHQDLKSFVHLVVAQFLPVLLDGGTGSLVSIGGAIKALGSVAGIAGDLFPDLPRQICNRVMKIYDVDVITRYHGNQVCHFLAAFAGMGRTKPLDKQSLRVLDVLVRAMMATYGDLFTRTRRWTVIAFLDVLDMLFQHGQLFSSWSQWALLGIPAKLERLQMQERSIATADYQSIASMVLEGAHFVDDEEDQDIAQNSPQEAVVLNALNADRALQWWETVLKHPLEVKHPQMEKYHTELCGGLFTAITNANNSLVGDNAVLVKQAEFYAKIFKFVDHQLAQTWIYDLLIECTQKASLETSGSFTMLQAVLQTHGGELPDSTSKLFYRTAKKLHFYEDDVKLAAVKMLLCHTPSPDLLGTITLPALQSVLKAGLTNIDVAEQGIAALIQLHADMPGHVKRLYPQVFPLLEPYFANPTLLATSREVTIVRNRFTNLQTDLLSFLGSVGGAATLVVADASDENLIAWSKEPLVLTVPFPVQDIRITLDEMVPMICSLATTSPVRKIKITACELLHAVVIMVIGRLAASDDGKMVDWMTRLVPVVISLARDEDAEVQRLFPLLLKQIINYYAKDTAADNPMVATLRKELFNAACSLKQSLRKFASDSLLQMFSLVKVDKKVDGRKAMLKEVYSMLGHAAMDKRRAGRAFLTALFLSQHLNDTIEVYGIELFGHLILSIQMDLLDEADPDMVPLSLLITKFKECHQSMHHCRPFWEANIASFKTIEKCADWLVRSSNLEARSVGDARFKQILREVYQNLSTVTSVSSKTAFGRPTLESANLPMLALAIHSRSWLLYNGYDPQEGAHDVEVLSQLKTLWPRRQEQDWSAVWREVCLYIPVIASARQWNDETISNIFRLRLDEAFARELAQSIVEGAHDVDKQSLSTLIEQVKRTPLHSQLVENVKKLRACGLNWNSLRLTEGAAVLHTAGMLSELVSFKELILIFKERCSMAETDLGALVVTKHLLGMLLRDTASAPQALNIIYGETSRKTEYLQIVLRDEVEKMIRCIPERMQLLEAFLSNAPVQNLLLHCLETDGEMREWRKKFCDILPKLGARDPWIIRLLSLLVKDPHDNLIPPIVNCYCQLLAVTDQSDLEHWSFIVDAMSILGNVMLLSRDERFAQCVGAVAEKFFPTKIRQNTAAQHELHMMTLRMLSKAFATCGDETLVSFLYRSCTEDLPNDEQTHIMQHMGIGGQRLTAIGPGIQRLIENQGKLIVEPIVAKVLLNPILRGVGKANKDLLRDFLISILPFIARRPFMDTSDLSRVPQTVCLLDFIQICYREIPSEMFTSESSVLSQKVKEINLGAKQSRLTAFLVSRLQVKSAHAMSVIHNSPQQERESVRRLFQCAFNALATIFERTQSDPRVFDKHIFKSHWQHIVEDADTMQWMDQAIIQEMDILLEPSRLPQPTLQTKQLASLLAYASSNQDEPKSRPTRKVRHVAMDAINSNACMPNFLRLIDKVHSLQSTDDGLTPDWMESLLNSSKRANPWSERLWLARVILNDPTPFRAHSTQWTTILMEILTDVLKKRKSFPLLAVELCLLLNSDFGDAAHIVQGIRELLAVCMDITMSKAVWNNFQDCISNMLAKVRTVHSIWPFEKVNAINQATIYILRVTIKHFGMSDSVAMGLTSYLPTLIAHIGVKDKDMIYAGAGVIVGIVVQHLLKREMGCEVLDLITKRLKNNGTLDAEQIAVLLELSEGFQPNVIEQVPTFVTRGIQNILAAFKGLNNNPRRVESVIVLARWANMMQRVSDDFETFHLSKELLGADHKVAAQIFNIISRANLDEKLLNFVKTNLFSWHKRFAAAYGDDGCRESFFDMVISLLGKLQSQKPEWVVLRRVLFNAIYDANPSISTKAYQFWSDPNLSRLPESPMERIIAICCEVYSPDLHDKMFLQRAMHVALISCVRAPRFNEKLYPDGLKGTTYKAQGRMTLERYGSLVFAETQGAFGTSQSQRQSIPASLAVRNVEASRTFDEGVVLQRASYQYKHQSQEATIHFAAMAGRNKELERAHQQEMQEVLLKEIVPLREYSLGDIPDIQIPLADFVNTIKTLAFFDAKFASSLFVACVVGTEQNRRDLHERSGQRGMSPPTLGTLQSHSIPVLPLVENPLLDAFHRLLTIKADEATTGALLRSIWEFNHRWKATSPLFNSERLSKLAMEIKNAPLGILCVESLTEHTREDHPTGVSNDQAMELAVLYRSIDFQDVADDLILFSNDDDDCQQGLLNERIGSTQVAVECFEKTLNREKDARMREIITEHYIAASMQLRQWSNVAALPVQTKDTPLKIQAAINWRLGNHNNPKMHAGRDEASDVIKTMWNQHSNWLTENEPHVAAQFYLNNQEANLAKAMSTRSLSVFPEKYQLLHPLAREKKRSMLAKLQFDYEIMEALGSNEDFTTHWSDRLPDAQHWQDCILTRLLLMNKFELTQVSDLMRPMENVIARQALDQGNIALANSHISRSKALSNGQVDGAWDVLEIDRKLLEVSKASKASTKAFSPDKLVKHIALIAKNLATLRKANRDVHLQDGKFASVVVSLLDRIDVQQNLGVALGQSDVAGHVIEMVLNVAAVQADQGETDHGDKQLAEFCLTVLESTLESKKQEMALVFIQTIVKGLVRGHAYVSSLFPRVLPILEKYPQHRLYFAQCTSQIPPASLSRWIPQILSRFSTLDATLQPILLRLATLGQTFYFHWNTTNDIIELNDDQKRLWDELRTASLQERSRIQSQAIPRFIRECQRTVGEWYLLKDWYHQLLKYMDSGHGLKLLHATTVAVHRLFLNADPNDLGLEGSTMIKGPKFKDYWYSHFVDSGIYSIHGDETKEFTVTFVSRPEFDKNTFLDKYRNLPWPKSGGNSKTRNLYYDDKSKMAQSYIGAIQTLKDVSPYLAQFKGAAANWPLLVPGTQDVKILKFEPQVTTLESARQPKKLTCVGSDGVRYPFLFKSGEDLRQDERIEQIFGVMNECFKSHASTRHASMQLSTYKVVPLTSQVGILEWLDNTVVLGNCILPPGFDKSAPRAAFSNKVGLRRSYDSAFSDRHTPWRAALLEAMKLIPRQGLRNHLMELSSSPEAFLEIRNNFTASTASMSIAGYLLGIGDRHVSNVLVHEASGRVAAIDFGHAFGSATELLPVPELIPFRLTENMVNVYAPLKTEIVLEQTMIKVYEVLSRHKRDLQTLVQVFVNEPTVDWTSSAQRVARHNDVSTQEYCQQRVQTFMDKLHFKSPAQIYKQHLERSICRKQGWMNGHKQLVAMYECEANPEARHVVSALLKMATSHELQARTWSGWQAWL